MKLANKLICALLAFLVFPAAYFLTLVDVKATVSLLSADALEQSLSLHKIVTGGYATGSGTVAKVLQNLNYAEVWGNLGALQRPLLLAACALAIALLCALLILILVFFVKNRVVLPAISVLGLAALSTAYIAFGRFAAPLLDGSVQVTDLLGDSLADAMGLLGQLFESLPENLVTVELLRLGDSVAILFLLFIFLLLWQLAYWYWQRLQTETGLQLGKQLSPVERAKQKEKEMQKQEKKKKRNK